jgi:uncharacterized protein (DUF486 family)
VLVFLFAIATSINLDKAFHIDDAFHLHAAQWISEHPLRPMSGTIDWSGSVEHYYDGNQPPLFFYGMAAWAWLFGWTEIAMHAFEALFTALCIVMFHRIARLLTPKVALLSTTLLAAGPAFIVNQNVMLDVPLLSMVVCFLYSLCRSVIRNDGRSLVHAALFLSLGALMKYSMLAFFPVLLYAVWRSPRKRWWLALVPLVVLAFWSLWNVWEFGFVHLLGRSLTGSFADGPSNRALTYIMTLGSIAPWLFAIGLHGLVPQVRRPDRMALVVLVVVSCFIGFAWYGVVPQSITDVVLVSLFCANGCAGLAMLFRAPLPQVGSSGAVRTILLAAVSCSAIFVTLLAPWMATRHALLVLPAILLLAGPLLERMTGPLRSALVVVTVLLGVALGVSDRRFAGFYRDQARMIVARHAGEQTYYVGALGWYWYAELSGMHKITSGAGPLVAGSLLATPLSFAVPALPAGVRTTQVEMLTQRLGVADRFSTRTWLRFYSAHFPDTPWTITWAQPEQIELSRVVP